MPESSLVSQNTLVPPFKKMVIKQLLISHWMLTAFSSCDWLSQPKHENMGLIERLSYLPLSYILVITSILKIGLIVCLCGTDLCTSGDPQTLPKRSNNEEEFNV